MIVVNLFISVLAIVILQLTGMFLFSIMTPFNDLEELRKGNTAVGVALGGKFLATAIILGVAAYTNASILHMGMWFFVGYVCLIATYWVFDWATPGIKLSENLQKGNTAVAALLAFVYVGIAFAVSSLIV
ncbi:DUF350 domain-containing protein [Xylanibacillus composti]|uniref:DUF350 domain-containing protein n=1 Tax=Xylanibacillus composti TaxID=1572762 RepID=A0A8J4M470_9BACL|nr:DUF350 domain-containing protein [Xylanibacillus composti]MDT9724589.1 DUF350 domain-containing protein [Xylanibacillus composti]GIQ70251.1 hypothetical protein XYCOK13_30750 [Xylanibacillus composti]